MAQFYDLVPRAGVDAAAKYMVVGVNGYNVIVLQDTKGFKLASSNNLDVKEITTREILSSVKNTILAQFNAWNLKDSDKAKAFIAALDAKFRSGNRLILLKGKAHGPAFLTATLGRQIISITTFVLAPKSLSVAFRFVKATDTAGNSFDTVKDASNSQELLNVLNWTFGPQTNVSLELADAAPFKFAIPRDLGNTTLYPKQLMGAEFKATAISSKNKKATITVYFVKDYISVDKKGISETYIEEPVSVVADKPLNVLTDDEKGHDFEVTFAHEVCHALQNIANPEEATTNDGHNDRYGILMCNTAAESSKIDEPLMLRINKSALKHR